MNDWFVPPYPWPAGTWNDDSVQIAPVSDTAAASMDLSDKNLILFGGPETNTFSLAAAPRLPLTLGSNFVTVNGRTYSSSTVNYSVIYPRENSTNYVVINKGFLWCKRRQGR